MTQADRFKTLPDNARIQGMGNIFKYHDRKTWDIGIRFNNTSRKSLKFSQLPYLSRQVVLNQTESLQQLGYPIEFTFPSVEDLLIAQVSDSGLVKFRDKEEQSQWCFVLKSQDKTIYLPQLELARALFFTNNYFANAALELNILDLEFYVDTAPELDEEAEPADAIIHALSVTQCPKVLFDNLNFRQLLAWLLLNSEAKSSFNSIYQHFIHEREQNAKSIRWNFKFEPPNLAGVTIKGSGWHSEDGKVSFINRINSVLNIDFPDIQNIGFTHPNFVENKQGTGKASGGTYPQKPHERDINADSDGSNENQPALIICDATLIQFNRHVKSHKIYKKAKKPSGANEDGQEPSKLPPDVSTDNENSRGENPRAAIDGLDDKNDDAYMYLNKFESFFQMLEILKEEHGVKIGKPIIRRLPEVGRSKKHLLSYDGSPRCIAIIYIEYQSKGYYLLEVDTSDGKASLATKVLSASALRTKGNLSEFIPEIESRLMEDQISWPTRYFDVLVGKEHHFGIAHQKQNGRFFFHSYELSIWALRVYAKITAS